jgi:hypothetical protein
MEKRKMNGSNSIHYLPSASFLTDAFVVFLAESCCRPFFDVQNRYIVLGNSWNGVQTGQMAARGSKWPQASQSSSRRPDAVGGKPF